MSTKVVEQQYVGKYVDEIKDALTASALAGVNAVLISKPGYGKTEMAIEIGNRVSDEHCLFKGLHYATPAEELNGMLDPQSAFASPPRFVLNREGSIWDEKVRVVILDEFHRTNDVAFSILMHAMERKDKSSAPVFWGTANMLPSGPRHDALLDRIAIIAWLVPDKIDTRLVVRAQLSGNHKMTVGDGIPAWGEVTEVRSATPGKKAIRAVEQMVRDIESEVANAGLNDFNPRRSTQWAKILFRVSVYITGEADFSEIPTKAMRSLRHAFLAKTEEEAKLWKSIFSTIEDPLASALDEIRNRALNAFNGVLPFTKDPSRRAEGAQRLGEVLAEVQKDLSAFENEQSRDRIDDTLKGILDAFNKVVRGEDIF